MKTFATGVEETHGPVDIVVNNAGNTVKKPFEEADIADFDEVMDVTGGKTSLGHATERRTLPHYRCTGEAGFFDNLGEK
ncbi:SDR family NAD(P)-dependent oxidoreductase [Rhizobium sp.]|uniref:SDR family NAD(P)-dependent oxidoreductase n=1 Tax=Rhizobium sp. TaxID=391 RepID=UPI0034C6135B